MQLVALEIIIVILFALKCSALDNGLAKTPPMGWTTRERFACNTDCKNYPNDCISEELIKSSIMSIISRGMLAAGYRYILVGDCWMARKRDSLGRLQVDPDRFPSGIKDLVDFVHRNGLKIGLHLDIGNQTCGGYPGSHGHLKIDADTMSKWKIDMVEMGACGVKDFSQYDKDFVEFGRYLNQTGRHMLYSCEWPYPLIEHQMQVNLTLVKETCNIFRTSKDMGDNWEILQAIIRFYGTFASQLTNISLPGSWNSADQLVIGNYGLSLNQQRFHMSLWSIIASPLFISADVRTMDEESMSILLNRRAIKINQDTTGPIAEQVKTEGQVLIYRKSVSPPGSFAVAIYFVDITGGPSKVSVALLDLGLTTAVAYNMSEIFTNTYIGVYKPWYTLNVEVNPNGVLYLYAVAIY